MTHLSSPDRPIANSTRPIPPIGWHLPPIASGITSKPPYSPSSRRAEAPPRGPVRPDPRQVRLSPLSCGPPAPKRAVYGKNLPSRCTTSPIASLVPKPLPWRWERSCGLDSASRPPPPKTSPSYRTRIGAGAGRKRRDSIPNTPLGCTVRRRTQLTPSIFRVGACRMECIPGPRMLHLPVWLLQVERPVAQSMAWGG